jgi:hypothetical protein
LLVRHYLIINMMVRYIEDRAPWRAAYKKENDGISPY